MPDPASGAGPGDRGFQILITKAVEFYLRHKAEIDENLETLVVNALMTIAAEIATGGSITLMNQDGPE